MEQMLKAHRENRYPLPSSAADHSCALISNDSLKAPPKKAFLNKVTATSPSGNQRQGCAAQLSAEPRPLRTPGWGRTVAAGEHL